MDLWWSGKHRHRGGNIQMLDTPDDWPIWTSPVRPGREHDTTARTHAELLLLLAARHAAGTNQLLTKQRSTTTACR